MALVTRSSEQQRSASRQSFTQKIAALPPKQQAQAQAQQQEAERRASSLSATGAKAVETLPQTEEAILKQQTAAAEQLAQTAEFRAQNLAAKAEWEAELAKYTKLTTGEYMLLTDFNTLSVEDQDLINQLGIKAFNEQKGTEFATANTKLTFTNPDGSAQYIPNDIYNTLSAEDQAKLSELGIDGFNAYKQAQAQAEYDAAVAQYESERTQFSTENVQIPGSSQWMLKTDWEALPQTVRDQITALGYDAYLNQVTTAKQFYTQQGWTSGTGEEFTINWQQMVQETAGGGYGYNKAKQTGMLLMGMTDAEWEQARTNEIFRQEFAQAHPQFATPEGYLDVSKVVAFPDWDDSLKLSEFTRLGYTPEEISPLMAVYSPTTDINVRAANMVSAGYLNSVTNQPMTLAEATDYLNYQDSATKLGTQDIPTAIGNQSIDAQDLVNLNTFQTTDQAQLYIDATRAVSGRTIEEAISGGYLSKEEAAALNIDSAQYDTILRTQNALAAIDNSLYRNADGTYNLEAIIRDNVLSPGDLILLFGSDNEEDKEALKQIINDVRDQKIAGLAKQYRGSSLKAASIARTYLDYTVPGYGTQRHWDSMPAWQKGVSIAADVLSIIPVLGAAGKGARSFSIATSATSAVKGKVGKAGAAVFGFSLTKPSTMERAAWDALSLAQKARQGRLVTGELWKQIAWAPGLLESAGTIVKPVKTLTGETLTGVRAVPSNVRSFYQAATGRIKASTSTLETLLNPYKLPESVVFDSYNTMRLRIADFDDPIKGMAARDEIQKAAMLSGNDIVIDTGDKIITVRRSGIMRESGGGLASGTPFGDEFIGGTIVAQVKGNNVRDGLYLAGDPLERFTLSTSTGIPGKRPAIVILSPETAARYAQSSEKTYKQWVELESVFPSGTPIPEGAQKLYTRMGDTGQRIDIYMEKPFTAAQIVKLKAAGLAESVKNFFDPAITITGKGGRPLTAAETQALADVLEETSPELATRIRFVGSDPDGVYRTLNYIASPEVYRIRTNPTATNTPRITMERVERLPDETARTYIERTQIEDYVAPPRAETDRLATSYTEPSRRATPTPESPRLEYLDYSDRIPPSTRAIPPERTPPPDRIPPPPRGVIPPDRIPPPREYAPTLRVPPPPFILPPGSSKERLTPEELDASVCWRQGLFWILRYPPYRIPEDIVWLRSPPTGVKVVDGPQSAYLTIQRLTQGTVGPMQALEMGFERVSVGGQAEGLTFEAIPGKMGPRNPRQRRPAARRKQPGMESW